LKAEGIEKEAERKRKREVFAKAQKLATAAGRKIPGPDSSNALLGTPPRERQVAFYDATL
jgi:hypothetical protein